MRARTLFAVIGIIMSLPSMLAAQPLSEPQDRISVTVEGTGPDIILIPGLASSREVWAGLAARLRATYRLHLVQVAGFAGSPVVSDSDGLVLAPTAEAIADYIQREHLETPVVIGHSAGGEMALMLGSRHPNLASALMIVDALPFQGLRFDPNATAEAAKPHAAAFRDAMMATPAGQSHAIQTAIIARLAKTEAARPALVAASLSSDRKTVADATYELMTTDLRPELGHLKVPVQVVYAYDPIYGIPAAAVDSMFRNAYAATPQARFTRIDDSFHFIMQDQPEAFARTVTDFLTTVRP